MTTTTTTTIVEVPPPDIAAAKSIARDVFVVDDFLQDALRKPVLDLLRGGGWRFGKKSQASIDQFSFWCRHFAGHHNGRKEVHYDCEAELKRNSPLLYGLWSKLAMTMFKGQTLLRCYSNGAAYGSDGTVHTDSKRAGSYTAVYYPHDHWEPDWAGETCLFNFERTDIVASVYPRPNRLLVFRGDIPHVARGVSRTCPELRITLMYKTGVPDDRRQA